MGFRVERLGLRVEGLGIRVKGVHLCERHPLGALHVRAHLPRESEREVLKFTKGAGYAPSTCRIL